MPSSRCVAVALLAPFFPVLLAQSVPIAVANPSFESPAIAAGTFATTAPPVGWSGFGALDFAYRTIGVLHPATTTLYTVPPPHGTQVGVVFLADDPANQHAFSNSQAGLQQTLAAVLQTNRRYTLAVAIGNIGNDPSAPFLFGGFPGYFVELQAGGVTVAADVDTLLPPEGGFALSTIVVDIPATHALAGQPLRIRLGNRNAAPGIEVNFDDVRLTVEPIAAWSDLGFGLAGVMGVPQLVGSGTLTNQSTNALTIANASPNVPAFLVVGLSSVFAPLFGGILVPAPEIVFALPSDAASMAVLPFSLAVAPPPGTQLFAQYWVLESTVPLGFAVSNAVRAITP